MREVEVQEIRDIYMAKGFQGKLLEDVVQQIVSDRKVWLQVMMTEELGFASAPPRPGLNGIVMSVSFVIGSFICTFPYLLPKLSSVEMSFNFSANFWLSFVLTGVGLLFAGAFKTKFTGKNIFASAFETLVVGALAAGGSYLIGIALG